MRDQAPSSPLAPTGAAERIATLDVLRGFALIGICIANVEFFNRPVVESGNGIPPGLSGIDWLTAFVVNYFITGKFWTIFSLLFGMGFALMLERATAAGRAFLPAYLRRVLVLGLFGLLHHVFLWSGDILISYAIGALVLMLTLFAPAWLLFAATLACLALATQFAFLGAIATPLVFAALVGLYLRARPGAAPFSVTLIATGALMLLSAAIMAFTGKTEGMAAVIVVGVLLIALALLARLYSEPEPARPLRAGLAIFVLSFSLVALEGGQRYFAPRTDAISATSTISATEEKTSEAEARWLRHQERAKRSAEERKLLASSREGSYARAVAMRTRHLAERLRDEMGFSVVLVGVFLVGVWFVRSGVILRAEAHLGLFRKLAFIGIPAGVLLGLATGLIATGRPPGVDDRGYDFAHGVLMLGSLPASLGYIGAVVLMLYSRSPLSRVRVLAPFGRMALTNYLTQSVVFVLLFYGHGLGLWGMGRTAQVGVALALCALQIGLSQWWLAHFRYGPAEWLWRALTYLRKP